MTVGNSKCLIRYRGWVGGGAGALSPAEGGSASLLTFTQPQSGTDGEVETLTSDSRYDEQGRYRGYGDRMARVHVGREAEVIEPVRSRSDRAGMRSNPQGAANPRRLGERREGPLQSWWRLKLDHDWDEEQRRQDRLHEAAHAECYEAAPCRTDVPVRAGRHRAD